ncbi:hypothetical protein KKF61_00385 [Patescibacteria group bacterium]|nr:hypothetical protein [Patescibacteria group bacterium]MBU0964197.1 hypothetical protein [Patescibacteria group bacterium]
MKRAIIVLSIIIASTALTAGVIHAAGLTANWLRIGTQEEGGVTFFNGTIINETTGEEDADNPVTFGDNVRIDGRVYRGATAGTSDSLPFIVNDNMEVVGTLTTTGLSGNGIVSTSTIANDAVTAVKIAANAIDSTSIADGAIATADLEDNSITSQKITDQTITATDIADSAISSDKIANSTVTSGKIQDGTIDSDDIADNALTQSTGAAAGYGTTTTSTSATVITDLEKTITTGSSDLLILFSGTFSNNQNGGYTQISLNIDGDNYGDPTRRGTSGAANEQFSLSFNELTNTSPGEHTIQVTWRTSAGSTSTILDNNLVIIELKK